MRIPLLLLISSNPTSCLRTAIVSGGTRGIGKGISTSLAKAGYDLVLTYNSNYDAALNTKKYLTTEYGVQVVCVRGDLTVDSNRRAVFRAYDYAYDCGKIGPLSAFVHNAGQYIGLTSDNAEGLPPSMNAFGDSSMNKEGFSTMGYYQTLYGEAYIDMCEMALGRMVRGGSIVGISSPGCSPLYKPNPGYDLPGTGKCIMEYASRLYALRGAKRQINCNVVVPGVTETEAWSALADARGTSKEELLSGITSKIAPMGKMQPIHVGNAVAFLCSEDGKWITGLSIPVDGGVHMKI